MIPRPYFSSVREPLSRLWRSDCAGSSKHRRCNSRNQKLHHLRHYRHSKCEAVRSGAKRFTGLAKTYLWVP